MSNLIRWPALAMLLGLCAAWAIWGGRNKVQLPLGNAPASTQETGSPSGLQPAVSDQEQRPNTTKQHGATQLKFTPEFADFGDVPVNESRTMSIQVSNPTAEPITLSDLRPSCGCLQASAPEFVVRPGKSIPLILKIAALPGKKKEILHLYFKTDESKDNVCLIEVHIRVMEEIIVEPNVLKFDQLEKNAAKTLETIVRSADAKPFKIKTVACARSEFTFKWQPLENGAAYKIFATLQSAKGGMTAEQAGIVTDREQNGTSPLYLSGTIKPDLNCKPAIVISQADEQRMVGAFTTVMKRTSPGRLEITGVVEAGMPPQNLPLDFEVNRLDENSCRLTIKFKTPYPIRAPFGQFVVKTNVEEEDFRLPFRVNGVVGTSSPQMRAVPVQAPVPGPEVPLPEKKPSGP